MKGVDVMKALANMNPTGVYDLKEDELREVDGGIGVVAALVVVGKVLITTGAVGAGAYTVYRFTKGVVRGLSGE
jgi:hypothetical protein